MEGYICIRINGGVSCKAITFPFLRLDTHMKEREYMSETCVRKRECSEKREKEREKLTRGEKVAGRYTYTYECVHRNSV